MKLGRYFVAAPGSLRPAQSNQILPMLGIRPGGHLPKDGLPSRHIAGIQRIAIDAVAPIDILVWVEPFKPNGRRHQAVHRIMCQCPKCGITVSLGRLHQHSVTH